MLKGCSLFLKMFRVLQMLIAAVADLDGALSLETLLTLKVDTFLIIIIIIQLFALLCSSLVVVVVVVVVGNIILNN
jgi:hypothetical protein